MSTLTTKSASRRKLLAAFALTALAAACSAEAAPKAKTWCADRCDRDRNIESLIIRPMRGRVGGERGEI